MLSSYLEPSMDTEPTFPPSRYCPSVRALTEVGDKWLLIILREAFYGLRRFEAIQDDLGISRSVLAARLERALTLGLLERIPYAEAGNRTRHEYRLTEKGSALAPVLIALADWGETYAQTDASVTVRVSDVRTGERVHAALVTESGEIVTSLRHLRADVMSMK